MIRALTARRVRERLELDGVVIMIDALRAEAALEFDLAIEQLAFADVVVISHVDEASPAHLDSVRALIARHAPAAVVALARLGHVDGSFVELLARRTAALELPPSSGTHLSIEAVSLLHEGELDEERFANWMESALGSVEARILRIKGILAIQGIDERVIVQGESEAVEVQMGVAWGESARTSRLVVLGLGLDAAALEAGFSHCVADG